MNFRHSRSYCPFRNTSAKVQTQNLTTKKFKPKEFRPKDLKLANKKISTLPHPNKPKKISYQDKKKEYFKKKWNWKNSSPITKDNSIKSEKKRNN